VTEHCVADEVLGTNIDQKGDDSMEVIDRLVHEIHNQLCVIQMEATMPLDIRDTRLTCNAVENIEILLGEIRQRFVTTANAKVRKLKQQKERGHPLARTH
jgi:hypothetical protein